MKTYPLFLVNLDQVRAVVVGGGRVAARKVNGLHRADARIVVIAPELCHSLERQLARGEIDAVKRDYRLGDLDGAFLVIAATDDPTINQQVWAEARALGLLVNVVDDPEHCNFIAPSVVRRGPLTLAISTSGRCPALSRHIRGELEGDFGAAYGQFVDLLGELRAETVVALSMAERRIFWRKIFESDVLALLDDGDELGARRLAWSILDRYLSGAA